MSNENVAQGIEQLQTLFKPDTFAGKTVLVTGASRGIGRAIAIAFGACGAKVLVNYAGNEVEAKKTCEAIEKFGSVAKECKFNVGNPEECQKEIAALAKESGGIDILVNNAGISRDALLLRLKEQDLDDTFDVNVKGAIYCSKAVSRGMLKKGGSIVNISSVIGIGGNAGQVAYSASKAAIHGFTKSLAKELGNRNIRVNAVAPGFIVTDMTDALSDDVKNNLLPTIPQGRLGNPYEVAQCVLFLCSPGGAYITGQVLAVDGGMSM